MKQKNIFNRLLIGAKKGLLTPTLPDNIIKIQAHPLIRILRFLGGISFLMILSQKYLNYPIFVLYFSILFALLFTIYHFFISYFRVKHIIAVLMSDKLDIKNSPYDRLATLSAKALMCFKGACETAQPVGLTLGLMLGTDEILKSADRQPIFAPFLGGILNSILPENVNKYSTRLITDKINNNFESVRENEYLLKEFKKFNLKGDISTSEFTELQTLIKDNNQDLITNNEELKQKLLENLNKNKK